MLIEILLLTILRQVDYKDRFKSSFYYNLLLLPHNRSESISVMIIVGAILAGIFFFKEILYIISLTVCLTAMMFGYVLFNSRRRNSLKNPSGSSEKEQKTSPKENVKKKE